MFKFCSLFSGSSGNSLLVQTSNTKILIDVGESCKKISNALSNIEIEPNSIDAIIVTHEHSDHIKGLGTFSKKYNVPVFANNKTWDAILKQTDKIEEKNINKFTTEEDFEIRDLRIHPFNIPHDAVNPCGFNIIHNNDKISIATDIGHMTSNIAHKLEDSLFVLLEANYDPEILKCSAYPYLLKQRIAGPNGHLENCTTGKTIAHLINSGLENALLIHLSKENNFPELAYRTVVEELQKQNYLENSISLNVAPRDLPSNLFKVV